MGDAHMSASELAFNFNAQQFHRSFLQAIADDQRRGCQGNPQTDRDAPCSNPALNNGSVPDVTPYTTGPYGSNPGAPVWQSAIVVISFNLWRHYGDVEGVRALYPNLRDFMAYLERNTDPASGLVLFGGLGDWVPPGGNAHQPTPTNSVSAFYWLHDLALMEVLAQVLGETADAAYYGALRANGTRAYHEMFFNATINGYGRGSQCSNMMALYAGVAQAAGAGVAQSTAAALLHDIRVTRSVHLNLGIVGTTFIFDTLAQLGEHDLILSLLLEDGYPSFGYMLQQNATTLWEAWEGTATTQVSSRNHIMFGGNLGTALYAMLAGLDTACNASTGGWQHVRVGPVAAAAARLGSGSATVQTRFGPAAVAWRAAGAAAPAPDAGAAFALNATVPAGATADIKITLLRNATTVSEGGAVVWQGGKFSPVPGLSGAVAGAEDGYSTVVFAAGSGTYAFVAE